MYHVGSDVPGQLETDTTFCHYHSIKPSPVCIIIIIIQLKLCTGIDFHFTVTVPELLHGMIMDSCDLTDVISKDIIY